MSDNAVIIKISGDIADIKAKLGDLQKDLGGTSDGLKNTGKASESMASSMTQALVVFEVFKKGIQLLTNALKDSVAEYIKDEKANVQLAAVLKSTGGAAGMTADAVKSLASQLSNLTTYQDADIQSVEVLLLRFQTLSKDVIPGATEAVLNVAEAMGRDLQSVAMSLGKALESPTENMGALRKMGILLTDSQEELVKSLEASGNLLGAQNEMLAILEKQYGGTAAAARDSFGGSLKVLQNNLSELGKELVAVFVPILRILADGLTSVVQWFRGLNDTSKTIIAVLAAVAVAAGPVAMGIQLIGKAMSTLMLSPHMLAFLAIGLVIGAIAIAISQLTDSQGQLREASAKTNKDLAELEVINQKLIKSTGELTAEQEKQLKLQKANKETDVLQDLTREIALIRQLSADVNRYIGDKTKAEATLARQAKIARDEVERWYGDAQDQVTIENRLAKGMQSRRDVIAEINEKIKTNTDLIADAVNAMAMEYRAGRLSIDQLGKLDQTIAGLVRTRATEIEQAEKEAKDSAKRDADKLAAAERYKALYKKTADEAKAIVEAEISDTDKLKAKIADLKKLKLSGTDEKNRLEAIRILEAKITEAEAKEADARVKKEEETAKKIKAIAKGLSDAKDKLREEEKKKEEQAASQRLQIVNAVANAIVSVLGSVSTILNNVLQENLRALQEQKDAALDELDQQTEEKLKQYDADRGAAKRSLEAKLADLKKQLAAETDAEKKKALQEQIAATEKEIAITNIKEQEAAERAKIELEYKRKEARLNYEAQMAQWSISLAQAISGAALAVINALAVPIIGPILAIAAGIAGAVQVAVVAANPPKMPAFAGGGLMNYSGLARMNEYGPETAILPAGTRILNASETEANDRKRSGDTIMHFHSPKALDVNEARKLMRKTQRELAFMGVA